MSTFKPLFATVALTLATAGSALAGVTDGETPRHSGFDGDLTQLSGPVSLDVQIGEQLAYLADNPGRAHGAARGLRNGFSTGGFLGQKSLDELREELAEDMTRALEKRGVEIDPQADTVLRVRLVDAQPNRPTFKQLSVEPSLSLQSFGLGGASLEGDVIAAGGESLGSFTYGYYTRFIEDAAFRGTWTDANHAMNRAARRVAKKLS